VAFSAVFQAFLTTFLVDSGYKTPIQNMDELFASGMKLFCDPHFSFLLHTGDETEVSNIYRNLANCPSYWVCEDWAKYQKNISILLTDIYAELGYATGFFLARTLNPCCAG
jgi:hypothetical protein